MELTTQELVLDDHVVVLDGRTVAVFTKQGSTMHFHVNHLAVEGEPKKDHLRVKLGVEVFGNIANGTTLKVPMSRQDEVLAFFAEAKARRSA